MNSNNIEALCARLETYVSTTCCSERTEAAAALREQAREIERLESYCEAGKELGRRLMERNDERDALSEQCQDVRAARNLWQDRCASAVAERDALQARVRELEAANCGIVEVIGFLRAENEGLRTALESSPCPCPISDDVTVKDCINAGHCGCDNKPAMAAGEKI